MIKVLQPRTCEHCDKKFLIVCHCQITPEELEANRIHTKNMLDRYFEAKAEFEKNNPGKVFGDGCVA